MSENTNDHVCCPCLREEQKWRYQEQLKLYEWRTARLAGQRKKSRDRIAHSWDELSHVLELSISMAWAFHQIQHFKGAQAQFLKEEYIKNPSLRARLKAIMADARAVRDRFVKHTQSVLDGPLSEIAAAVDSEIDTGRAPLSLLFRLLEMKLDAETVLIDIALDDYEMELWQNWSPEDRIEHAARCLGNEILARETNLQK